MKKLTFLFSLLSCFAFGQTHDSTVVRHVTAVHDSSFLSTVRVSHDSSYTEVIQVPDPVDSLFRGMYITGTKNIAGNKAKEDILIANCNKLKLTHLSFYSLSGSNATALSNLFIRIRKETKVKQLCATSDNGSSFLTTYGTWNNAHSDSSDYDCWNLEYEPWNASDVATAWSNNRTYLQQMSSGVKAALVKAFTDYYGWWSKSPMTTQTPDTLVKYLSVGKNFFLLHDYRVKPDYGYLNTRLTNLNDAARRQGKVIRLRPIFSAEPDFLQPWLKAGGTLEGAFFEVYNAFKAKNFSNIIMDGWMCFHMDFWIASQPVPLMMAKGKATKIMHLEKRFRNKTTRKSKRMAKYLGE